MKRTVKNRILAILLICIILASSIIGCGQNAEVPPVGTVEMPEIDEQKIIEKVVEEVQREVIEPTKMPTTEEVIAEAQVVEEAISFGDDDDAYEINISQNPDDYIGDIETFVYGLLINEISLGFEVFPGYAELSDGKEVFGLAYTDYSECYQSSDEKDWICSVGFIPFYGEYSISKEEYKKGVIIENIDDTGMNTQYIATMASKPFMTHCVVYGKYVKYGVGNDGVIFYEESDFDRDKCDESIGSLYSYDDERFLIFDNIGESLSVTGESLSQVIDYSKLEKEINAVLEKQDFNFAEVDVESYLYTSQKAVEEYLRSIQEETFLGYNVEELIKLTSELDARSCFRITNDGIKVIEIEPMPRSDEEKLARWLVITGCVVTTIVGMVGATVTMECPALSATCGAMTGGSIDILMQLIVENKDVEDIDWRNVCIAVASGAVSGFVGPYVAAQYSGMALFIVDSCIDGVIGGLEYTTRAYLDGKEGKELIDAYGEGAAIGFCMSAGFKVVGKIVGAAVKKVSPTLAKAGKHLFPNLSEKVADSSKILSEKFGKKLYALKDAADSSIFHSEVIAHKMSMKLVQQAIKEGDEVLLKKAFDKLGVDDLYDASGNRIVKDADLLKLIKDAPEDKVVAYFKVNDEIVKVKKHNQAVGIFFDKKTNLTVEIPNGLTKHRDKNFEKTAEVLIDKWSKNSSTMPQSIKDALEKEGTTIQKVSTTKLVDIIQSSDLVIHENLDLKTISLVSREVHRKISHFGGVGLEKYLKSHMGKEMFERFLTAASSAYSSELSIIGN